MPDTQRSIAAVTALLADNIAGDISAQDARDELVTLQNGMGEISITASAATTLADTTTWVLTAGTFALTAGAMNWAMTVNGRLYYTGTATRAVHIAASISMTAASNNVVTEWAIAKNGTPLTPSILQRKIGTGADVGSTALHGFTTVATGDYLSIKCRNTTSATNVTCAKGNLFVMDMAV